MSLFRGVSPVNAAKKRELELELEFEKNRFIRGAKEAAGALRYDLSLRNIAKEQPVELAIAIMLGGIFLGTFFKRPPKRGPEHFQVGLTRGRP